MALQKKFMAVQEEMDELKSSLKTYQKTDATVDSDIARHEEQINSLLEARNEGRARHKESLQTIKGELSRLRKETEDHTKRAADRIVDLNQEITEISHKIKENDELIVKLRATFQAYEPARQRKLAKIASLHHQENAYRPYIEFLRASRAFPMFLEDLGSRVFVLQVRRTEREETMRHMHSQIDDLHRANAAVDSAMDAKHSELRMYQAQVESAGSRLEHAGGEIERTQRALEEAGQRLEQAREQTQRLIGEHSELDQRMADVRCRFSEEMADLDRCQAEFEADAAAIKNSKAGEVTAYEDRIQRLRHKITLIKERDTDPDQPAVDVDLRHQVDRVRQYQLDLIRETERCDEEKRRLEVQMSQKTWDLQTLAMKTQPTPSILAMPLFHEKFILLKELVLQNMEMKLEMGALTERLVRLKAENREIRIRLMGN
jgi:chromosome segregation ATPase